MPHMCHAKGCTNRVPPRLLMCADHWALVPKDLQKEVWRTYRKGQEDDKAPSRAYIAAARAAINAVAAIEAAQAEAGATLDPETLFAHPDDVANPIHKAYSDAALPDVFIVDDTNVEPLTPQQKERLYFWYNKTREHTHKGYASAPCATCNGRGGKISGEYQGDPPMVGYVEWFEPCDDCICDGFCPDCGNATLTQGVYEAALEDISTFTCDVCGWQYKAERFNSNEPNDHADHADPRDDPDFEGYPGTGGFYP